MTDLAATLFIVCLCTVIFHNGLFSKRDNTDQPRGGKRSGLIIYTDYGTGCQYLGTIFGGITPRLDKDGKPVCIEPTQRKQEG